MYQVFHPVTDPGYLLAWDVKGWLFGAGVLAVYGAVMGGIIHALFVKLKPQEYRAMNIFQYMTMQFLLISMFALPVKMVLWHVFKIKYVLVTPWLNV